MSGYTRTSIIECARSQSEEAQGFNQGNPDQWTNRVGDGLKLKAGDQISVHSSYISEIGAESGEIEIKGESLNQSVDVRVLERDLYLYNPNIPTNYQLHNASLVKKTIDIRDDTLNLIVSPYKCSNGENYAFLPRKYVGIGSTRSTSFPWDSFDQCDGLAPVGTDELGQVRFPRPPLNQCPADVHIVNKPISQKQSPAQVETKVAGKNDGSRFTIFTREQTLFGLPNGNDVIQAKAVANSSLVVPTNGFNSSGVLAGMTLITSAPISAFAGTPKVVSISASGIVMSADATTSSGIHNTFTFQFAAADQDSFAPPTLLNSSLTSAELYALRDPALWGSDYIQVKDLITLKINPGYNSPTDVSVQLTEEINQRTDIEYKKYTFKEGPSGGFPEVNAFDQTITFITESPAYKSYNCATATDYSPGYFTQWEKIDGTGNTDEAYKYLKNYQNIGIKRPEFYVSGQKLNASTGMNTDRIRYMVPTDQVFLTDEDWKENNLLRFKEFFDTQKIYPDLFDEYQQSGYYVSAEETRLLHMNLYDNGPNTNIPGGGGPPIGFGANIKSASTPPFGYDYYVTAADANQGSFPLFIDNNPDKADLTGEDVGYCDYATMTSDYNDLAYGFARKVRISETEYRIGFQFTRTGNKIPAHFFHANASRGGALELGSGYGRRFGFDRHFSSYGNLCMILTNGNHNDGGSDRSISSDKRFVVGEFEAYAVPPERILLEKYQFGLYLGADGPVINYDQTQQRFQLERFHTPELVGNIYNAGFTNGSFTVPNNPDAGQDCYKINKRSLNTNYSPEIAPYNNEFGGKVAGGTQTKFSAHNPNITEYSIMDATSGLFIEDWIVPEKYWDQSLVGILGFRYEQFHNPNSTDSRQVRIKAHGSNAALNNVNVITTNADVNEVDLVGYSKNVFGISTYQRTLNVQKGIVSDPQNNTQDCRNITPAIITSPAQSVKINAKRLPSKTLRPYYTIRSDIILQNTYLGGGTSGITLPIVAVTNKANPYGDFLNGIGGEVIFTNTVDRVLTSVKCSIHEPDGRAARVDLNSAVIFKIDQQIDASLDVVGDLLQSKKKADQEQAQILEDPDLGLEGIKFTKEVFQ